MIAALRWLSTSQTTTRIARTSFRSTSGMASSAAKKGNLPYGWAISDRIKDEVVKQDVWTVFSPASGFMPKVNSRSMVSKNARDAADLCFDRTYWA